MTQDEFTQAAREIAEFLGATAPSATRLFAWHRKVQFIPSEAMQFIQARITDESDTMPKNLPKAFRAGFDVWLKQNPDKVAKEEQGGCSACEGGVLFLEREKDGKKETACVFCRCFQGNAGVVGRASLYDMQSKGWRSAKPKTIAPVQEDDREKVAGHMSGARDATRDPDPLRYDGYEARYDEERW